MILITRPINEAKTLAKKIESFNVPTIIEPLISFRYFRKKVIFNDKKIFIISSFQSVHALRLFQKNYEQLISFGRFLVVGLKVSKELRSIGVGKIIKTFDTSDRLLKYLSKSKYKEYPMEYLCGSVSNQSFINGLNTLDVKCQKKIIYKTIATKKISKKCLNLLKNQKIKIVLVYSEYTALVFSRFIKSEGLMEIVDKMQIICLSKRISDTIGQEMPSASVQFSRYPNQAAMIKKIELVLKN